MKAVALCVMLALTGGAAVLALHAQEPVYEAGDGVTLPSVIKEVRPEYTAEAKKERAQGTVVMRCVVRRNGRPTDIEIVKSLHPQLDESAIAALRQWEFKAGTRDEKPVDVRVSVEMTFTLK
jgi:protein TonB